MPSLTSIIVLLALCAASLAAPSHLQAYQSDVSCLDNDGVFIAPGVVTEAAECIDFLASLGSQECTAGLATSCRRGNTQITGIYSKAASGEDSAGTTTMTCQDVAHAAGRVMDFCSQGSGAVKGQTDAFANTDMLVDIRSVERPQKQAAVREQKRARGDSHRLRV